MDFRRFLRTAGRLTSSPISDFWQVSTTAQDPETPNLPLESPAAADVDVRPQDAEWDWSEQLSTESLLGGYQNSDATPVLSQAYGDVWDWSEAVEDEWAADQTLQSVVIATARQVSDDWDWTESLADEWTTDQTLQSVVAAQPVNDDWDWNEPLSSETIGGGYQQADYAQPLPKFFDEWQWDQTIDDEWGVDEVQKPVVITPDPIQHTHSEWDWDEVLSPEIVVNGYQQADNATPPSVGQPADLEWDFESGSVDEDGWSNHFTNYDPVESKFYEHDWDWSEVVYDDAIDYQTTAANAAVVTDPIQHTTAEWDWDEALYPELVVSGYQQADNAAPVSSDQAFQTEWEFGADLSDEDGWSNHFTNYDPLSDQSIPDVWGWDERADDDWWTEHVTVANVAVVTDPIQHTSAEWDWDEVLYSDIVTSGYQQADNAAVSNSDQQPQTDWDFDSDFGGEGGWNNHFTSYDPETQTFDDPWDWDESCEYEWQDESKPVVANNAPVISPVQHTTAEWDWDETVENEWQDYRDAPVGPDGAVVEDQEPRRGRRHSGFRAIKDEKFQFEGAFVSAEAGAVSVTTQQEAPLPKFDAPQVAPQSAPAAPAQPSVSVSWVLQTAVATAVTGISTVRTTTSARFAVSGASVDTTTVSAEFVLTSAETTTESGDFDDVYTEDNFTDEELLTFALSALK